MHHVELWTDGSGTSGAAGGWAYILRIQKVDSSWVEREVAGPASVTTNNRMELMGVIMGLRALNTPCHVTLYSDSEYVVKAIAEKWIGKWKNKNWKKIKNVDLWKEVDRLLGIHDVTARWVRGHSNVWLNERCDVLAGEQRQIALKAENFLPEPAGDNTQVQPALAAL